MSRIFKRLKGNLQCRLLLDSFLNPPDPTGDTRCGWRGLIGRWRGPRNGDCHCRGGRGACLHPFGLSPGRRSRETARRCCQYSTPWKLWNWPQQQFCTWRTRLLEPCVCASSAGPSAPVAERRPTPRSDRRSYPRAALPRSLRSPTSPRTRWTRCCLEPQHGEPPWWQRRQQGADLPRFLPLLASPRVRWTRCGFGS
jgi:hypothetical protein